MKIPATHRPIFAAIEAQFPDIRFREESNRFEATNIPMVYIAIGKNDVVGDKQIVIYIHEILGKRVLATILYNTKKKKYLLHANPNDHCEWKWLEYDELMPCIIEGLDRHWARETAYFNQKCRDAFAPTKEA